MKSLGQAGSARPKVHPGGFDSALEVIVAVRGDEGTRDYLTELVAATAAHDQAREGYEFAKAEASRRETVALEAEATARSQREALATETAETASRLSAERAELKTERQRLGELGERLETKRLDLQLRESAIGRAFAAFTQGE